MFLSFVKLWPLLIVFGGGENERAICERLAPKYEAACEVLLWDHSRCDLVNARYAIEVDWAPKWPEAVGQTSYYAILLDREPAILLLVRNWKTELRYVMRAQIVCAKLGIRLFIEEIGVD